MSALTNEEFHKAVSSRYRSAPTPSQRLDVILQLDKTLRDLVARLWEDSLLLEFEIANPPTGDEKAILGNSRGTLGRIVETWRNQSSRACHTRSE